MKFVSVRLGERISVVIIRLYMMLINSKDNHDQNLTQSRQKATSTSPPPKRNRYAETPQLHCPEKRFFGGMERQVNSVNIVDGDKAVCLSSRYSITPGDCLVYSFGIAGDWSFDDAMAEYGCQVRMGQGRDSGR